MNQPEPEKKDLQFLQEEIVNTIEAQVPTAQQRNFVEAVLEALEYKFVARAKELTAEFEQNQFNHESFKKGIE